MEDRRIEGLDSLPSEVTSAVLTIGNFDGVHVGHRQILAAAKAIADREAASVVALTFDPPPDLVLRPDDVPQRITPPDERARLLLAAGADCVITAKTDKALLAMSPDEFIRRVVVARFAPRHVVEGSDFAFGAGRRGTVAALERAGGEHRFDVHVVDPVMAELPQGPTQVSSTLIRKLLSAGKLEQANDCLGRPFTLFGPIVRGHGRGRELGFPTVNIDAGRQVSPGQGVYGGKATIGPESFAAAISVGRRPTFETARSAIEAFLIDAEGDYYGQFMALSLVERLRDQCRFADAESLKDQIAKDVQRVRKTHE